MTRDRFISGALMPANWYVQAQRFRRWFRDRVRETFCEMDILVTPATPCTAPLIGIPTVTIDGIELPKRGTLSRLVQPFSFIGWPSLVVPVAQDGTLPVAVQLVARPYEEASLLRAARSLELAGVARARLAV